MDAQEAYLALYDHIPFQGTGAWTLDEAMVPHDRTVLPEHNLDR